MPDDTKKVGTIGGMPYVQMEFDLGVDPAEMPQSELVKE